MIHSQDDRVLKEIYKNDYKDLDKNNYEDLDKDGYEVFEDLNDSIFIDLNDESIFLNLNNSKKYSNKFNISPNTYTFLYLYKAKHDLSKIDLHSINSNISKKLFN